MERGSGPGSTWCGGNEQGERRQTGEGKGQGRWGGRVGPVCMLFDLTITVHVVWVWDKERMSTLCAGPGGDAAGKAPTTAPAAWSLVYGRSDSTVGSLLCR